MELEPPHMTNGSIRRPLWEADGSCTQSRISDCSMHVWLGAFFAVAHPYRCAPAMQRRGAVELIVTEAAAQVICGLSTGGETPMHTRVAAFACVER